MAQGCTRTAVLDGRVEEDRRVYFTQDGVQWLDLAPVAPAEAQAAAQLTAQLSGDPAAVLVATGSSKAAGGLVRPVLDQYTTAVLKRWPMQHEEGGLRLRHAGMQ